MSIGNNTAMVYYMSTCFCNRKRQKYYVYYATLFFNVNITCLLVFIDLSRTAKQLLMGPKSKSYKLKESKIGKYGVWLTSVCIRCYRRKLCFVVWFYKMHMKIFLKFTQTLPFCFIVKHVAFNSFLGTGKNCSVEEQNKRKVM